MSYWRYSYLRETDAATRNSTYKLEMPDHGLLGSLFLRLHGKPATGNPFATSEKWRLIDYLDKIELIANGDYPIISLTGKQAQFCGALDQKVLMPSKWLEYSGPTVREYILLNFGRWLKDPNMGLDLGAFDSMELQITNSCATASWQDDLKWSIMALWLEDAGPRPFNGYLKREKWREWTTVADETKYLKIPTSHIIRRLILQAIPDVDANALEETSIFDIMNDIEFTFKTGTLRVFKGGIDDLLYLNLLEFNNYMITGGWTYHTADYGFDVGLGYVDRIALAAGTKDDAGATAVPSIEGDRLSFTQKPETYEAGTLLGFIASGIAYHNCGFFDFDGWGVPSDWINPEVYKDVKLDIHTANSVAAADGYAAVCLERFVSA